MDTQDPPSHSKRNHVKEVFQNALRKIQKIRAVFALRSRDPRSSPRSLNLTDAPFSPPMPSVGHTTLGIANQLAHQPTTVSHESYAQSGTEPSPESPSSAPGANDAITTPGSESFPSSSGPATTDPGPHRPAVWAHLEAVLATLERSTRAIHPLHSLARAILDCMEIFEGASTNSRTYETLANELHGMASTLNRYAIELGSEPASRDITQIAESIQHCMMHINQQRDRNGRRQLFDLARDRADLANCGHQIESLSREMQATVNEELLRRTSRILHETKKKSEDDWLRCLGHVEEARYNSDFAMQLRRHGCISGTRAKVQDHIKAWASNPGGAKVLWMNGMPGTGKTAISYSICEWLQQEQRLGASYFCTRASSVCASLRRLIPTIAYQLSSSSLGFRSALCKAPEELRDSHSLEPHLQFERLLAKPLQEAQGQLSRDLIIVIDGLDECEDDYSIRRILEQFLNLPVELPIKVFITSRPERVILNSMSTAGHASTAIYLHNIDPSVVRTDIMKYLAESLKSLPPTEQQIEQLTRLSGNLFIYAATVVEYLLPHHMGGDPMARLKTVLMNSSTGPETGTCGAYERLHLLYSDILKQALKKNPSKEELEELQLILWSVICAQEPMTIKALAGLVGVGETSITSSLGSLHSVLHVAERDGPVTILHASFSDFIRSSSHPTAFRCKEASHGYFLARRCFEIMESQLEFNICKLETSFSADSDIPELGRRIHERISPELFYACRYWGFHLQRIVFSELEQTEVEPLHDMLSKFLSRKLLSWMEVLNLQKQIEIGAVMLTSVRAWLVKSNAWTTTQQGLLDARNFFTRFASNHCSISTPHIYLSALPSCPRKSTVYKNYWPVTRRLLNITGSAVNREEDAALARWLADGPVSALACPPDGARIASGSRDGSVRIWNTHTGMMIGQPVKLHQRSVLSIKFSPDGAHFASASFDRTICLCNATTTGIEIRRELIGHQGPVFALDFSSNGACLASGSGDGTVHLWDSETGALMGEPLRGELEIRSIVFALDGKSIIAAGARTTMVRGIPKFDAIIQTWNILAPSYPSTVRLFSGHKGPVLSVDLSPDGARIATGGSDHTIRLWQVDTGNPIGRPFKGHTDDVLVVKFSSNGNQIISGSSDQTIQIWDVGANSPKGGPFKGHSDSVGTIMLIPGDTRLISGSDDATIRIWDTDVELPTDLKIKAHKGSICSVIFSPNGDLIFSGSEDESMRVWSVHTGTWVGKPIKKYGGAILSVACSPNMTHYAAGSRDATFLVGDIHPGPQFAQPVVCREHCKAVQSVAFSADGTLLVTGSEDRTIKAWDPRLRPLKATDELFARHQGPVTAVTLARSGHTNLVISGSGDKKIRLHDTSTGSTIDSPPPGHKSSVLSVACSASGDCIASGSYDKEIRIWDGCLNASGENPISGHSGAIRSVALFESPSGTHIIASGSDDTTVRLWNANTGAEIGSPLTGHTQPVWSVSFSPDGKYVVSGSKDGEIRLWDIKSRWASCAINAHQNSTDGEGSRFSQASNKPYATH